MDSGRYDSSYLSVIELSKAALARPRSDLRIAASNPFYPVEPMTQNDDKIGAEEMQLIRDKFLPQQLPQGRAVLEIAEVALDLFKGNEKVRSLRFTGYGDTWLRLNNTQIAILVAHLGDTPSKWRGRKVPVEVTVGEFEGKPWEKVYVCETSSEWDLDTRQLAWK